VRLRAQLHVDLHEVFDDPSSILTTRVRRLHASPVPYWVFARCNSLLHHLLGNKDLLILVFIVYCLSLRQVLLREHMLLVAALDFRFLLHHNDAVLVLNFGHLQVCLVVS